MKRNRLYLILALACIAGYSWLFYSITKTTNAGPDRFGACMFKSVTGIPCPSCGTTRAMVLLVKGDLLGSLLMNPFGLILAAVMLVVPVLLAFDLATKKQMLFNAYNRAEKTIKIRWISILLIAIVLANWAWNIYKNV